MSDPYECIQQMQQEIERLRETLTKANKAASFMHEEPYRTMLGLGLGDHVLFQGVPELKCKLDKAMQELERIRLENAALRRELYPPRPEQRELRYWIVTWLGGPLKEPQAVASTTWPGVLELKDMLEKSGANASHINILEQRALL